MIQIGIRYILKRWDIFCKVVDNFGDIGVCWRLATQLQQTYGFQVCLWVDDLITAQRLIPSLDATLNRQFVCAIEIVHWHAQADFSKAAEVVIEAFACNLPISYLAAMQAKSSKWINLEYLSAEPWVAECHAQPSPKPPLTRYFYFPGFASATGGLLREHDLLARHQTFQSDNVLQMQFWRSLKLTKPSTRTISLFAYAHAPLADLFNAIVASEHPTICLLPSSALLSQVANYFEQQTVSIGQLYQRGSLTVVILPFLSQADYDRLLSACDINFVRGEDSWVRAIWAAKPFIWQPYQQQENTHLVKLGAFLNHYYADFDAIAAVKKLQIGWVQGRIDSNAWQSYTDQLFAVHTHTSQMAKRLGEHVDLTSKLVAFSQKI